jgi:hypothetical protein
MVILSNHVSDEPLDGRLTRRTIGNWRFYRDPSGLWAPCASGIERYEQAPDYWGTGAYEFSHGARAGALQVHFGDKTAANGAMCGMRESERPDRWINMKLLNCDAVEPKTDGSRIAWRDVMQDTSFAWEARASGVTDEIEITGRKGPRSFAFAVRVAPGHKVDVVNGCLVVRDREGVAWLCSRPAYGVDGNGDEFSVSYVRVADARLKGGDYTIVEKAISEKDHAERPLPMRLYPTTTLNGTTALDDTTISIQSSNNYGGLAYTICGVLSTLARRALYRCVSSSIPKGRIVEARLNLYRRSNASSANSNTINAYVLKDTTAAWVEGTSTGSAQSGSCSWSYTVDNTGTWVSGSTTGPSVEGTDYDTDASPPSNTYAALTSGSDALSTFLLRPAWLYAWRDGERMNNGVILRATDESTNNSTILFRSNEDSTKPALEIDYLVSTPAHLLRAIG